MVRIRLLQPGDEHVLGVLADEDAEFDVPRRGARRRGLRAADARSYLADPSVRHWVAEADDLLVGHLLCYVQRRRAGSPRQVMVYEVGVREGWRRRGIGRELFGVLDKWMNDEAISGAWLLADDPAAVAFYEACGFRRDGDQPLQMSRGR